MGEALFGTYVVGAFVVGNITIGYLVGYGIGHLLFGRLAG